MGKLGGFEALKQQKLKDFFYVFVFEKKRESSDKLGNDKCEEFK